MEPSAGIFCFVLDITQLKITEMKKLFAFFAIALLGLVTWSCSYDDKDLWSAVNDLDGRMKVLEQAVRNANTDIEAVQKLVKALQQNVTITSVVETADGYTIHFSDDTKVTITNGASGTNVPALSVVKGEEGLYYWALDGEIVEVDGHKVKAEGADGITPQLRINPDTKEWEMSTDGGQKWTSMGVKAEGSGGDSIFSDVQDGDAEVTFTLADGKTTIIIPKTSATGFAFIYPEELPLGATDVDNYFLFAFGEEKTLSFTGAVKAADLMNVPQGWSAEIDSKTRSVKVTAPSFSGTYYTEGFFRLSPSTRRTDGLGFGPHLCRGFLRPQGDVRAQRGQHDVRKRFDYLHHGRRSRDRLCLLADERFGAGQRGAGPLHFGRQDVYHFAERRQ